MHAESGGEGKEGVRGKDMEKNDGIPKNQRKKQKSKRGPVSTSCQLR